ncbi:MAG TPA: nucleoside/nucleotide kinase family protein [Pseudonocardiaceae bacterium]|jgi:pantothenate kinase|nr:nucleoside/nucleotide kinase family protein [Pseudonocardiaceae bacterium]
MATDLSAPTFADLVAAANQLADNGKRRILGITGAPAAGKSTLARRLVAALGDRAVEVGMDGFHLAQRELARLGRSDRKGAPDTFDAVGYVALLRRLRAGGPDTVYAPEFRRDLEEPVGSAIPVPPSVPLVVTEGNYLLLDDGPWRHVRPLLDEVWFLAPPEDQRLARLVGRHRAFGRTEVQARDRAFGSDQANATLVAATAGRADRIFAGWIG